MVSRSAMEAGRGAHDPLTGLAGHELLVDYISQALVRAGRQNWVTAVVVVDIDDFSDINEAFGHNTGDQVLVVVAARLLQATRGSDVVSRPGPVADADDVGRFGADRFVIVCENVEDADGAARVAARIARLVAEPVTLDGGDTITITARSPSRPESASASPGRPARASSSGSSSPRPLCTPRSNAGAASAELWRARAGTMTRAPACTVG